MRIYVCGPLSSPDPEQRLANVQAAIDAAIGLYGKGHVPFVPHLSHYIDLRQQELGAGLEYEDWMRVDREWLRLCHGLLFLGHSPGATRELGWAADHGLMVFFSLDEVPDQRVTAVSS